MSPRATSTRRLAELLQRLTREGRTIVLVTHDDMVAAYAGRTLSIEDGVVTEGKAS